MKIIFLPSKRENATTYVAKQHTLISQESNKTTNAGGRCLLLVMRLCGYAVMRLCGFSSLPRHKQNTVIYSFTVCNLIIFHDSGNFKYF